jgi:hypothetical protein
VTNKENLYVVWHEPETRAQYRIGVLGIGATGYEFVYDDEGLRLAAAHGFVFERSSIFPTFPKRQQTYCAPDLFPVIAHRLPDRRRPDYVEVLRGFGLPPTASPFEILRKTRGRLATDQLSFEEAPAATLDGVEIDCFVAGWRFFRGDEALHQLVVGDPVLLERDVRNKHDRNAVAVKSVHGHQLGYVPSFHADTVSHGIGTGRTVTAHIIELNLPPTASHDRAKIRIRIVLGTRRGMTKEEIEQLAREQMQAGLLPRGLPGPLHSSELEGYEPIVIGPAVGRVCSVCGQPITDPNELTTQFLYAHQTPITFHSQCFDVWNDVRRKITSR